MSWLKYFSKPASRIGIELAANHVNIVVHDTHLNRLDKAVSLHVQQQDERALSDALVQFAKDEDVSRADCHAVLGSSDYQLLMVERPEVPESELREAIKWKVKDLIQAPIESVVLETFNVPRDASKGKAMVYVVVVALDRIQMIIDAVKSAGLNLKVIDVEALALRNVIALKNSDRASAVVRLSEGRGEVSIYRENELYLSRSFSLKYNGGLLDDIPAESLALEVQRSFDYFERQMGQVPPAELFVCGESVGPEKISEELKRSIAANVEYLNLHEILLLNNQGEAFDEGVLQLCTVAIGTALRQQAA